MIEIANKKLTRKVLHGSSASTLLIPRSIAVVKTETNDFFPRNVSFVVGDITESRETETVPVFSGQYDTVLCMSVVKWIHLNHGDKGLLACFQKLWDMTKPGGRVILEYQMWKSYKNNCSKNSVMKANFEAIAVRPEDFERVLESDFGFQIEAKLGTPLEQATGFNRPILVLLKPCGQITDSIVGALPTSTEKNESTSSTTAESNHICISLDHRKRKYKLLIDGEADLEYMKKSMKEFKKTEKVRSKTK
jgi:7SK snRNA methylphosphate capping enzyme